MTPDIQAAEVILHLRPDASFVDRFGASVAMAGGAYTAGGRGVRGHRYVRLPVAGNAGLIDDVVRSSPMPGGTTMIVNMLVGAPAGKEASIRAVSPDGVLTLRYPSSSRLGPSAFIRSAVADAVAAVDWAAMAARPAPATDPASARDALVEAALGFTEGTVDIGTLRACAEAYRESIAGPEGPAAPGPA